MKTVKLSCPRCQAENHYAVADLQAANGRVQCSQCRHAFTVTRKPKAQSAPAAQAEILQEDVIHAKMPLREKLARLKQQSAALAAQQAGQDADEPLHTQKKPLAAELDEIDSRLRRQRMALDNDTGQAMPFKLAEASPPNVPASAAAVHSEFNWTLASLAALTVLIMQLFYYLLIMKH